MPQLLKHPISLKKKRSPLIEGDQKEIKDMVK